LVDKTVAYWFITTFVEDGKKELLGISWRLKKVLKRAVLKGTAI